ncbi:MAG: cold shock domain-containing protein [Chloroflexi bacterium]|nr:cold shock domain-containing protein [Chloroflexota bacterium]
MNEPEARYRGVVKWFAKNKGYGFIEWREGTRDVFVHYTAIARAGQRNLERGELVEFSVQESAQGWQAVHVIPLHDEASDGWSDVI